MSDPLKTRTAARSHLYPHFTQASAWLEADMPVIVRGEGCYVYDSDGRRFLDGLSGMFCVNLGHGRKDLAEVAARQMQELGYWTNWSAAHPRAIELATTIADLAPADLDNVFLVSSGSEAVESALKFARQYHAGRGEPGRVKFIARDWAYHGTTMGALSVTGIPRLRAPFGPLISDVRHFPNTRVDEGRTTDSAADLPSIDALRRMIAAEGPDTIAAILVEPVQNAGGALVPAQGYWRELRKICDQHGILLIADEVICGFGRLGEWFGSAQYGGAPDLITFAKGVTSGYVPLGGVIIRRELAESVMESGPTRMFAHGTTWGGHPVGAAVALANMEALRDEDVLGNVRRLEPRLQYGLSQIAEAHPTVQTWRGTGFLYAVEFTADSNDCRSLTTEQSSVILQQVIPEAMQRARLMTRADDRGGTMLVLAPPLVADEAVLDDLLRGVDSVAAAVDEFVRLTS